MTEKVQQEKPKNLIPSSFSQAFLAGTVASSLSFVIGVPVEYLPRVAVAGISYSLFLSWKDSRIETSPRKKAKSNTRQIPFNHGKGSQKIDMEFSMSTGGYMIRESYLQAFVRKLSGKRQKVDRRIKPVERPRELDEFIFHSQGLQLREIHIKLFLKSAWRNREYGKGLSARRWVRNFNQRPAWYKELSPAWYYAAMELLWKAGCYSQWNLVVRYDNSWLALVNEPRTTLNILKWYESEKSKKY
jgi:hypothetical protein